MPENNSINNQNRLKKCPNCGRELPEYAKFCKSCGTRIGSKGIPIRKETEWRKVKKRVINQYERSEQPEKEKSIERICPKCNTIVNSKVLEQCPVCFTKLPALSEKEKEKLDTMLFTGKKMVSEKSLTPDKNKWSLKEATSVFFNSIMIYVLIESVFLGFFMLNPGLLDEGRIPINEFTLLISPLISIIFGVFPLIYISKNKHNFKKIGFREENIIKFILTGIIVGILFYFFNNWIDSLVTFFIDKPVAVIAEEKDVINNMGIPLVMLLTVIVITGQIFEEILFRGVIQNALGDYLENKNPKKKSGMLLNVNKWNTIFIICAIYSVFYFIIGLNFYYLILNLVSSLIVGIVYEFTDRSMVVLIFMKISYIIMGIVLFFLI
ncbi:MAG: CPBP family glutamic-type intramembrane protease [Promethearchaeota archaeon]